MIVRLAARWSAFSILLVSLIILDAVFGALFQNTSGVVRIISFLAFLFIFIMVFGLVVQSGIRSLFWLRAILKQLWHENVPPYGLGEDQKLVDELVEENHTRSRSRENAQVWFSRTLFIYLAAFMLAIYLALQQPTFVENAVTKAPRAFPNASLLLVFEAPIASAILVIGYLISAAFPTPPSLWDAILMFLIVVVPAFSSTFLMSNVMHSLELWFVDYYTILAYLQDTPESRVSHRIDDRIDSSGRRTMVAVVVVSSTLILLIWMHYISTTYL